MHPGVHSHSGLKSFRSLDGKWSLGNEFTQSGKHINTSLLCIQTDTMLQLDIMQIAFKAMMHCVSQDSIRWDIKIDFLLWLLSFLQALNSQWNGSIVTSFFHIVTYIQVKWIMGKKHRSSTIHCLLFIWSGSLQTFEWKGQGLSGLNNWRSLPCVTKLIHFVVKVIHWFEYVCTIYRTPLSLNVTFTSGKPFIDHNSSIVKYNSREEHFDKYYIRCITLNPLPVPVP